MYFRGSPEELQARHDVISAETGTHLFSNLSLAQQPDYSTTELHCWENSMSFDATEFAEFLSRLVAVD